MKNRLVFCAMALAAVAAAACDVQVGDKGVSFDIAQGRATEEWVRSYTIAPGGRLEVSDVNGEIDVSAAPGKTVEIRATREARAGSDDAARALLAKNPMVEQVSPSRVVVRVQPPDANGVRLGRSRVTVAYHVQIPAGLSASFRTENGAVRLDNVNGHLEAASTNGAITGRDLAGSITASTVNGGIQMGLASVTGDVELETVNGGVRLELAPSVNGQLEARTVNGGVSVDDGLSFSASDRSRTHASGTLNKGGPKISVQTTNGGVRVMPRAQS